MKISIVTINYNGAHKTLILLESLKAQTSKDFDLIIVDNASAPDDFIKIEDWVGQNLPTAKLIKNSLNLGFSGGCNTGIKKAIQDGVDWVILLNNDTFVESDFIERLRLQLLDEVALIGLAIKEDDGNIAHGGYISWLKPTLAHGHGEISTRPGQNGSIRYAIGGGMAIHRSTIEKIGYFDENYFLYFEDADYSLRAQKVKMSITFLSEPVVQHTVSASTKLLGTPKLLRYHYRNALYFNRKHGPWWVQLLLWPWSWLVILKQSVKIIIGHNRGESKAILRGVLDFYAGKMGYIK